MIAASRKAGKALSRRMRQTPPLAVLILLLIVAGGCGSGVNDVLLQAFAATGQTIVDLALTEAANSIAEACEETDDVNGDQDSDNGNGVDGGNGDNGDNGDNGGNGGGELDGAQLMADNCAACHGADGASGFAPDITGMSGEELSAGVAGPSHVPIDLTDAEYAAIAEFLDG
ncbi:MAG: cytochrome c [Phycisphaerales bacterium]|nr:MAG: cytochrome c [Phycisphaerales bacterium]